MQSFFNAVRRFAGGNNPAYVPWHGKLCRGAQRTADGGYVVTNGWTALNMRIHIY